ncbi:type I glyceraldehyde-3-phosphate dehydrogenase [Streptacidiphilus sp. EB129]|uniref:type I glyceraldehyde-3-phosphate dehydrogenase n=1 Tax=Streptacidiphilus sp. EB129 TaxID=3156262 RepID=UPI0035155E84
MSVRVGINGFGRIGRDYLRCVLERADAGGTAVQVVAVNDVTDAATLAHLLQFDSTYGRLRRTVAHDAESISVDGHRILVSAERDPAELDWGALGVDVVIEATGRFRTRETAGAHLKAGARKVLLSVPGKDVDATVVMGVNEGSYDPDLHHVVSNASCTTNCVAPMVKVLDDAFGITDGLMTTIHSYTNDQVVLDGPHKDLRRGRTAAVNIVPTSTGAARAVGQVLPALDGVLDGIAVRVPVEDGSLTDLTLLLREAATAEDVNDAFRGAARGPLHGILRVSDAPLVSRDIIGDPASCIVDAPLTQVHGRLVKVFGWYDNEWGYTNRLLDLTEHVAAQLEPR